jgi:hypothetical protein
MQGKGAHAAAARGGDAVTAAYTRETSHSNRHSGGCPSASDELPESVCAAEEARFGAGTMPASSRCKLAVGHPAHHADLPM